MFARSLVLGLAASVALAGGAMAADYYSGGGATTNYYTGAPANDVYSGAMFNFEGAYAGVSGGGYLGNLDGTEVGGGTLGVIAGVNFAMSDLILAGLEFQGGVMWPDSDWDWEAYGLGRVGYEVGDGILAYGAVGLGRADGKGVYAFGGGVEVAAFNPVSVRGEILGVGEWGTTPSAAKATAGVLFHFN
jgi:outer membrane immunogenic protein